MGELAVIAIKFLIPAGEFFSLRGPLKVSMRPLQRHAGMLDSIEIGHPTTRVDLRTANFCGSTEQQGVRC